MLMLLAAASPAFGGIVADEVMVRFKPGTPARDIEGALRGTGAAEKDSIPGWGIRLVKLPPGVSAGAAVGRLERNPNVEIVEPNVRLFLKTLPNDPLLSGQWGLVQIRATQAWSEGVAGAMGAPGVVIAVVDTGVLSGHPDLGAKIVPGFNSWDDTTNTEPGAAPGMDHGTAVASVAAAATNNSKGMAGVAWEPKVMPIKAAGAFPDDMTEFHVLKGLAWAVDHGARVVNMSLGSCEENPGTGLIECGPGTAIGADAMRAAYERGVVLVASAGNESTSLYSYPAAYPHVMGVAATTVDDRVAGYSNWGDYVDVAAPGGVSTVACRPDADVIGATSEGAKACAGLGTPPNDYRTAAGTSSACPHVAGLAAVLIGQDPNRSAADVVSLIQASADQPAGSPAPTAQWDATYNSPSDNEDFADSLAIDPNGYVVVAGHEKRLDLVETNNWLVRKYDSAGGLAWSRTHSGGPNMDDKALAVAADLSGNVVVAGYETTGLLTMSDWMVRMYDSFGNVQWTKIYAGAGTSRDAATAVAFDPAGNVVAGGNEEKSVGDFDWLIRKYDSLGNVMWTRTHGSVGMGEDRIGGVATDALGNVIVAGHENRSDIMEGNNWLIRKYDPAGLLLWERTYTSPAGSLGDDVATGVAVDPAGNIVVAGYERRSDLGQSYNWLVRKYSSGGGLIWTATYNSPINGDDFGDAVATDSSGNIVVAGVADRSDLGESHNMMIRKYDRNGALQWVREYDAGVGDWDGAYAVGIRSDVTVVAGVENRADLGEGLNWSIHQYVGGTTGWSEWNPNYGHGRINMYRALTGDVRSPAGGLASSLAVLPSPVGAGMEFRVALAVVNNGSRDVTEVAVAMADPAGAGGAAVKSLPPETVIDRLAPGAVGTFTWTYLAASAGPVGFSSAAAGIDSGSGGVVVSSAAAATEVLAAPESSSEFMVYPNPVIGDRIKLAIPLKGDASELTVRVYNAASLRLVSRGVWRNVARAEGGVIMDGVGRWAPGMYLLRVTARLLTGEDISFPAVKLMVKK